MTSDEQLRRAFEALTDRLHDDIHREVQIAVDEALSLDAVRPVDLPVGQPLLDGVRWLGRAQSLSEILDTLARCAAREARRAAVLTVRGGRMRGWRFIGFEHLDQKATVDVPLDDARVIASAVRANAVTSGQQGPSFAELRAGASCVALPIALAGEVVAVLYADEGSGSLESRVRSTERLEILARYAARGIEALTAFRVARSLAAAAAAPEVSGPAANEDEDAAALRYARLLVSEIRLYHEDAVTAGRRERDLAVRLGGEISRARVLYEQRVGSQVRQRAAYFDDELVRALANGDASLLELRS